MVHNWLNCHQRWTVEFNVLPNTN